MSDLMLERNRKTKIYGIKTESHVQTQYILQRKGYTLVASSQGFIQTSLVNINNLQ